MEGMGAEKAIFPPFKVSKAHFVADCGLKHSANLRVNYPVDLPPEA